VPKQERNGETLQEHLQHKQLMVQRRAGKVTDRKRRKSPAAKK
jgi:hypothetical protein